MSVANNKREGFEWLLASPHLSAEQRAVLERERDGWLRLDPLGIWDLIPGYRRPTAPADKIILQSIEMHMRRDHAEWVPPSREVP